MKQITLENCTVTRINNDINGNPRRTIHFLNLITDNEVKMSYTEFGLEKLYKLAVRRANKYGGKKYHCKAYGGGIVFQSYNDSDVIKLVNRILNEQEKIAFISSVISSEFFRPLMVRTLLSQAETHRLIAQVALETNEALKLIEIPLYPELQSTINEQARIILFESHNIKL